MSVYINLLVILFLLKYLINQWPNITEPKIQKSFLITSSIILALFTGLRDPYTGADTLGYGRNFLNLREYSSFSYAISEKTGRFEFLYKIWVRLIGYITDNVNVFFTITAIFVAVFVGINIWKNSKNPYFSIILYYTVGNFTFQMTGLRQAMAMAVILYSVEFIKEKKLWKFLLTVWIASLFHKSALAFVVAYPLANMKINFKSFVFYFGTLIFAVAFRGPITMTLGKIIGYDEYEGAGVSNQMGGFAVIGMLLLTLILCYIFFESLMKQSEYNHIFFNITMLSLIIYILRYTIRVAERVSFYYQFAFVILLPNVIEAIPDKKTRKTVYVCAILLASALFFYRYQIKPSYYGFLWN